MLHGTSICDRPATSTGCRLLRTPWPERCVMPRALSVPLSYVVMQLHWLPVRQKICWSLPSSPTRPTQPGLRLTCLDIILEYHHARTLHRRIGAQSSLSGTHFCPKIVYEKLTKCLNFTVLHDMCPKNYQNARIIIFPRKINKIPQFYIARKCPNFTW